MPGLGASFGRGAATNYLQDLENSDCILFMGSNMAEAHPVGFRFPMRAKENGARLIHVDPRFSRTSACCDTYVGIRAGSDIAFLGGLINYVLTHERWFEDYVLTFTNASVIVDEAFQGPEELGGIFSGYDPQSRTYESGKGHWDYQRSPSESKNAGKPTGAGEPPPQGPGGPGPDGAGARAAGDDAQGVHGHGLMGGASTHASMRSDVTLPDPDRDPTLRHPRCAMQLLRKHFARYTPEMVAEVCGCSADEFRSVAEAMCDNSGPDKTTAIVYGVGWTHHSVGPQIIRASGILQLLLGNIGRPGGMIMAMRGHCSIQGSTDIPTLYDLLPGYLPQPTADETHKTIDDYCKYEGLPTGYWANTKKFTVSLMKAYYGEAATKENDFHFDWLPRLDGDYSHQVFFDRMAKGMVEGYFVMGQNPAAGAPNAALHRAGLRELDWLVVADWFETETATFWKNDPKGPPPSAIKTEVFLLPAASIAAKEGTFTNTQRLIQWHDKAVDPEADCRSDLWFIHNLGKRLKEMYAGSARPQDQAIQALTWVYNYDFPPVLPDGKLSTIKGEPDAEKVLQEINGFYTNKRDQKQPSKQKLVDGFADLKDDGTTACGGWIYSGIFPDYDRNRARERKRAAHGTVHPDWGFAWPHNRRVMYNRASADASGKPWSEGKKLVWWDADEKKWVGDDVPDFPPDKAPDYRPPPGAVGMEAIGGDQPFIMKPDGLGWLFAPAMKDGPFPAHYEPVESPVRNLIYPKQQDNPAVRYLESPLNLIDHVPSKQYRIVACTFRLTEHYLSGPMSRFNSWLNELQPEMFVELSPELAAEKGIEHGGWMTVQSARGTIEAKAMVTRRLKPLAIGDEVIHQVGIPFHWGYAGETVGGIANDLSALSADPNVSIQETKVFTVDVWAGRSGPTPVASNPYTPWPTTAATPDTPKSAQPEGQIRRQ